MSCPSGPQLPDVLLRFEGSLSSGRGTAAQRICPLRVYVLEPRASAPRRICALRVYVLELRASAPRRICALRVYVLDDFQVRPALSPFR